MKSIKNQQKFHLINASGKKTICGLSNQYNDALDVEHFKKKVNDLNWVNYCCSKCSNSL